MKETVNRILKCHLRWVSKIMRKGCFLLNSIFVYLSSLRGSDLFYHRLQKLKNTTYPRNRTVSPIFSGKNSGIAISAGAIWKWNKHSFEKKWSNELFGDFQIRILWNTTMKSLNKFPLWSQDVDWRVSTSF